MLRDLIHNGEANFACKKTHITTENIDSVSKTNSILKNEVMPSNAATLRFKRYPKETTSPQ